MKVLFLSHSYPPVMGGVETQNYNLSAHLSKTANVKVIANGKGKKMLPFFLVFAFFRSFFMMTKFDVCLLGNGVLAPLGAVLKFFHPQKRFYCIVHGLDVTYADRKGLLPFVYRKINVPSLKKMDKLFMVGNATIEEAVKQGVPRELCHFIPNGIDPAEFAEKTYSKNQLEKLLDRKIEGKKIILRLGRFVPHKGTSWFIENVVPSLPSDVLFVAAGNRVSKSTAGDKDDFLNCEEIVKEKELEDRVVLLQSLAWDDVKLLLHTADLVVSPNIKISGTMEGFGINAIEAGICERVVLASNLEGLADAIKDGKNGILANPEDAEHWIKKINSILGAGSDFQKMFGRKAAQYIKENLTWGKIAKEYLKQMEN